MSWNSATLSNCDAFYCVLDLIRAFFGLLVSLAYAFNLCSTQVKVREAGTDWGWGVVVNVVKKPVPQLGSLPPTSRGSNYIVDTLLHCSIGSSESGSRPRPCPPRSGQKGEMHVVSYDFCISYWLICFVGNLVWVALQVNEGD